MLRGHLGGVTASGAWPKVRRDEVVDELRDELPLSTAGKVLRVDVSTHEAAPLVEDAEALGGEPLCEEAQTHTPCVRSMWRMVAE